MLLEEDAAQAARADGRTGFQAGALSLTQQAYQALEELIVTLQLAPGEVLSEGSLTRMLDIGRTPVREALQRLALEGLVVILPRRGILVSEINVSSQLELLRLRREVERLMCRLAAERATREQRASFKDIAAAMDQSAEANNDVAFMRCDRQYNLLLAHSCGNLYARKTMRLMQGLSRRFWYQHYKEALDLPHCARLHADCARAIGAGDAEAAAGASDALLNYIEAFTRATLEANSGRL